MSHHAHVFHSFGEFLAYRVSYFDMRLGGGKMVYPDTRSKEEEREAKIVWKKHIEKNGNVPMIIKCFVCSGEERKQDIKHGRFSPKRESKVLRDERDPRRF